MLSDTLTPGVRDLPDRRRTQPAAAAESGGESAKWPVSARLRLIVLPCIAIWGVVIWIATSLI
jgi:hypothetical protein